MIRYLGMENFQVKCRFQEGHFDIILNKIIENHRIDSVVYVMPLRN